MEFDEVINGRRSIRGFKEEPVSTEVINELAALASRAPSSMNTQPYYLHVVTGEPLERIREGNTEQTLAGVKPSREIISHGAYQGRHRDRQKQIAVQLFEAMGIEWGDKGRRQDWVMRGFRQFDAPVSIVVTMDGELKGDDTAIFDCGAMVTALVNAAWSRGIGCVINGQGIMQSPVVREHAQIPEDQLIVTCIAMGYPAEDFPANDVVSERRGVDEIISFVGYQ